MRRLAAALLLIWTATGYAAAAPKAGGIEWQPWSDGVFERAAREQRFVLLDLEAVWCHWCHVMDEVTYSDPKVIALIKSRYIAVRVDHHPVPASLALVDGVAAGLRGGFGALRVAGHRGLRWA